MRLLQSAKLGGGSTLERTKIKLSELLFTGSEQRSKTKQRQVEPLSL